MKQLILFNLIFFVALVACAPAPTATPISAPAVIEGHPYQWINNTADFAQFALDARRKGMLAFAGEFGFCDPIDFTERQYEFFHAHAISYAVYSIELKSNDACHLMNKFGVTERGELARKYWNLGQ